MKNKNLVILFILMTSSIAIQSQDILDVFAQEACDCASEKDLDGLNTEQMSMELGFCIMESIGKHTGEFEKEHDVNLEDQQSMQKFGEKIGIRMATKCPATLQKLAGLETSASSSVETLTQITGVIESIGGEEFSHIMFKDESGRSQKILWLRYFDGSDELINNSGSLIGQNVKLTYGNIEVYSSKLKDYYSQKEIRGLEKL